MFEKQRGCRERPPAKFGQPGLFRAHGLRSPGQLAAHTHPIEYGIYEGGTASALAVSVDGNAVPSSALQGGEFDAAGYLSRDADGRIERGAWHTVAFTPDAMTRITASVYVRTFLRSLSGDNL